MFPEKLEDVEREHIVKVLHDSSSMLEASQRLGISYRGLYDKCDNLGIERPIFAKTKNKELFPNNRRSSDKAPFVKDDGREVVCWVSPEERDYYYNLDFLTGTYHGWHSAKGKGKIPPSHGLGYGEDEE